jgi:hypothetical protein
VSYVLPRTLWFTSVNILVAGQGLATNNVTCFVNFSDS